MQELGKDAGLMKIEEVEEDDYVPLAVLQSFIQSFLQGFMSMMQEIGFRNS